MRRIGSGGIAGVTKRGGPKPRGRAAQGIQPNRHARIEVLNDEQRDVLTEQCQDIYDTLIEYVNEDGRRLSDAFLVKPPKKFYPDYYVLIKYPIAFDIITKRLDQGVYMNLKDFLEDIHLMFSNAKMYNQEGSLIYQDATTLEEMAREKCAEYGLQDFDFTEFDSTHFHKLQPKAGAAAAGEASSMGTAPGAIGAGTPVVKEGLGGAQPVGLAPQTAGTELAGAGAGAAGAVTGTMFNGGMNSTGNELHLNGGALHEEFKAGDINGLN